MKYALFTSGYRYRPLEQAFADAARLGYSGIELCGERPHAFAPDIVGARLDQLRRWIDQYQVPVIGYCPKVNGYPYNLMLGDRDIWNDSLAYVRCTMDAACRLGAEFTVIAFGRSAYDTPASVRWRRMRESLLRLADYASRRETFLLVEPLTPGESEALCRGEELARLLEEVNCRFIAGMCDTVVPFLSGCQGSPGESIDTYFDVLGPRLRHIHMTDSDGRTENHILPGEGIAPLGEMLATLQRRDYRGYITIELVDMYNSDPSRYAALSMEYMQKLETALEK